MIFFRKLECEREGELLSVQQVYAYLAQGRRFRSIRSNGFLGLGGYRYSVGSVSTDAAWPFALILMS